MDLHIGTGDGNSAQQLLDPGPTLQPRRQLSINKLILLLACLLVDRRTRQQGEFLISIAFLF